MDAYEVTLRQQIGADQVKAAHLRDELRSLQVRIETREQDLQAYLASKKPAPPPPTGAPGGSSSTVTGAFTTVGGRHSMVAGQPPTGSDLLVTLGNRVSAANWALEQGRSPPTGPVPTPEARRDAYCRVLAGAPQDGLRANVIRSEAAKLLNGFEPTPDMFSRDMDAARDEGVVQSPLKGYWRLVQPQLAKP